MLEYACYKLNVRPECIQNRVLSAFCAGFRWTGTGCSAAGAASDLAAGAGAAPALRPPRDPRRHCTGCCRLPCPGCLEGHPFLFALKQDAQRGRAQCWGRWMLADGTWQALCWWDVVRGALSCACPPRGAAEPCCALQRGAAARRRREVAQAAFSMPGN